MTPPEADPRIRIETWAQRQTEPSQVAFQAELNTSAEPEFIRASSFAGKPVPMREWLVPDLIPQKTVTRIDGDGAAGKSLLAL